jgi:hypothetical protein
MAYQTPLGAVRVQASCQPVHRPVPARPTGKDSLIGQLNEDHNSHIPWRSGRAERDRYRELAANHNVKGPAAGDLASSGSTSKHHHMLKL